MVLRYSMSFDEEEVAVLLTGLYTAQQGCRDLGLAAGPLNTINERLIKFISSIAPDVAKTVQATRKPTANAKLEADAMLASFAKNMPGVKQIQFADPNTGKVTDTINLPKTPERKKPKGN